MMVLLIALFALPAKADNGPGNLYLAYLKNSVWNYSKFEQKTTDVYTCTHTFGASEKFYIVKGVNAASQPSTSNNTYEIDELNVSNGYSKTLYLYGESKGAFTCTNEGTYTLKVDFTSKADPTFTFSSKITEPTYNVSIVGYVGQDSSTDTGTNLSYVGNGIYSGEVNLQGSRYFRVIIDGSKFGPNSDTSDKFVAEGTTETIYMNKDSRAFQAPLLNKKYFVSVDVYNNTVAISTDVYLVGDVTGGWNTSDGWKFDTTDGVTYTLTGKNMTANKNFKLRTSKDVWYGNGKTDITVPYNSTQNNSNLTTSGGNMQLSSDANNVNITFNIFTGAFSISGGSTPTPSASYRLKTSADNWNKTIDLTDDDNDGIYSCTMTDPAEGLQFMVQKDGSDFLWPTSAVTYSGGEQTINLGTTDGQNITMGGGLSGEYTITLNPDAKTLTIKSGSTPTPSVSYRLKYTEDNWSNSKYSNPLTDNGNGTYGYTFTNPVEGLQFMVQKSTDSGKSYVDFCWPAAEDKKYTGGEKTFIMSGAFGNNVTFGAGLSGDYTLTFTPNETATASTLKISGASVAAFGDVYLTGSFNGWKTDKDNDNYKFTTNNGKIYTLTSVNLNLGSDPVTMKVYKGGTYYGYDKATVVGPAVSDGNDKNIKLTKSLVDATITFDITDATKPVIKIFNPNSVYLHGDFTDPAWKDNDEYQFSTTDNQTYVLEHVNLAAGKLLKVNYSGVYYGHDAGKVTGPVELENETNYNMRLTEALNDATIIFTMPTPFADNWTLTIGNGGVVEHKPYYFAGDLNRWYDKSFEGGSKGGIDAEIFEAEKDKWAFKYVGDVDGLEGTGWYKLDFKAQNLGTLLGQFQIIDRGSWDNGAEVYSHNPKVTNYEDASGFARYINSPITRDMIKSGKVLTKDGTPGIVKGNGSNFHLGCNGVNNAVIYFLPGDNPKMKVQGDPTDYFIFYSAEGKSGGNNADSKAVSMEIVNGKPNEVNYFLPGVKNLKNYTKADASAEGPHMNIAPVELTKINFSDANFDQTTAFESVFGASENVGNLSLGDFVNMIKTKNELPNGTSLDGRGEVYVIKIPNGFEYAAGTKFAVKFDKAFAESEIGSTSTIVANHLYFFNDKLHVMLNVDNYEDGAEAENADVKLYYRVYGYDDAYNTVVVNSDGSTTELYKVGTEIGYTEKGTETQKTAGWVEYNHYGVMPDTFGAPAGNWHYATPSAESTAIYGLDPKFGNFFVQFKIVTGPKKSQATNGPAKVVDKEYTLYLPEKTLALNQEGFYNFNGQDIYQKFDGGYTTTDVEDVFEDQIVEEGVDAEPIFFNLQGQRVVNPEKGMYIVVKGNKTYKVMIK